MTAYLNGELNGATLTIAFLAGLAVLIVGMAAIYVWETWQRRDTTRNRSNDTECQTSHYHHKDQS